MWKILKKYLRIQNNVKNFPILYLNVLFCFSFFITIIFLRTVLELRWMFRMVFFFIPRRPLSLRSIRRTTYANEPEFLWFCYFSSIGYLNSFLWYILPSSRAVSHSGIPPSRTNGVLYGQLQPLRTYWKEPDSRQNKFSQQLQYHMKTHCSTFNRIRKTLKKLPNDPATKWNALMLRISW